MVLNLIFEIEDTNRDGVINNLEDTTPYTIAEEPVLQLFDYYPKVSTRSEVDIDIETTTKFEDAQIDGFVVENPVSYKMINYTLTMKIQRDLVLLQR